MSPEPLRYESRHDGQVAWLTLDAPPGNVLDAGMVAAIRKRLARLAGEPRVKLVVFEGAGRHFSFGASVEEHLPGRVAGMLADFHAMFRQLEALSIPTASVVRGQCLGGGCELVTWTGRVVCDERTKLGQPEIRLGVFPPMASLALRFRVSQARATELVTTGAVVGAMEALHWGLVDEVADDPASALDDWFQEALAPLSASSLRFAWRAARRPMAAALEADLPALEQLYLDELMATEDPVEGLQAFLDKRTPVWSTP